MFLTDVSWAESCSERQTMAEPFQAWRCIGMIDEGPSFLVIPTREIRADARLPDSWLMDCPETLLAAAEQLTSDAISVFALDRGVDGEQVEISRVTGIWRETDPSTKSEEIPWFWYTTDRGEMKPCSRRRGLTSNGAPQGFVNELAFNEYKDKSPLLGRG